MGDINKENGADHFHRMSIFFTVIKIMNVIERKNQRNFFAVDT